MLTVLVFWLLIQAFAWTVLPLAWTLLSRLPERGYVLAKPLGLLLVTYVFWLGASSSFLGNTAGGMLFAWLLVAALSSWLGRKALQSPVGGGPRPLAEWIKRHWRLILTTELLFAVALVVWAFVRSHDAGINSTEKPMEFAFLNGILRSDKFPPLDPWLSGFSISYYYFGYVMMALLTKLSGAASGVGYISSAAMWFALTVTTAFGVTYDAVSLAAARDGPADVGGHRPVSSLLYGLLGPLFVAIMGNLEGLFELLHSKGVGGEAFYRWLDVKDLATAPLSPKWYPGDNWWWWRASRVIHDKTLSGASQEVIDEFPLFSFLLGDMHPHVLALPFVLLFLGLILNLLMLAKRDQREGLLPVPIRLASAGSESPWMVRVQRSVFEWWSEVLSVFPLGSTGLVFYALCLGSLGFLNTWDVLPHLFLLVLAYGAALAWRKRSFGIRDGLATLAVGAFLAVLAVLCYLPFFLTFSSQAGGVWPNLYNPTRVVQFFLMFGPFLVAAVILLTIVTKQLGQRRVLTQGLRWLPWIVLIPVLILALAILVVRATPQGREFVRQLLSLPAVQSDLGGADWREALRQVVLRRISMPGTYLLLAVLLAWSLGLLSRVLALLTNDRGEEKPVVSRPTVFVVMMLMTGFLLTFGVEFAFLKDTFGTRMNTVFKFYYQVWVLFSIGSAFAISRMSRLRGWVRPVSLVLVGVLVLTGMVYPAMAIYSKSYRFEGPRTLDGLAYVEQWAPDEAAAITWLKETEPTGVAVVLEAPGGSFRAEQSRVSSATGLPTLVGWTGHELQWRGTYDEVARREPVIENVYRTAAAHEIPQILAEWDIEYVFVGPVEYSKYGLTPQTLARLDRSMDLVFEQGSVRIYQKR